jgi:hypothetical protein
MSRSNDRIRLFRNESFAPNVPARFRRIGRIRPNGSRSDRKRSVQAIRFFSSIPKLRSPQIVTTRIDIAHQKPDKRIDAPTNAMNKQKARDAGKPASRACFDRAFRISKAG